jgi:hypothetical protein
MKTINEMWDVLSSLTDSASVQRDVNGMWYVSLYCVEIKCGAVLSSGGAARGMNPDDAIRYAYTYYISIPDREMECIVLNAYKDNRREVIWNGHMWKDIKHD